jgi:hypothetical protein
VLLLPVTRDVDPQALDFLAMLVECPAVAQVERAQFVLHACDLVHELRQSSGVIVWVHGFDRIRKRLARMLERSKKKF